MKQNSKLNTSLFIIVVSSFLLAFVSYILVKPTLHKTYISIPLVEFLFCIIALGVYVLYLKKQNKLTIKNISLLIIIFGILLHLTYMLYTPYNVRQYDTFTSNLSGHYAYALSFYNTGKLPTNNIDINTVYQFYHPPLNAAIQGLFMHIFSFFNPVKSLEENTKVLYGSNQILSFLYMSITLVFAYKTLVLTKTKKSISIFIMLFIACFPRLIQMSGQLNNDALSIMFMSISLYYAFKWYNNKKGLKDIGLLALFIGLSMSSKLSGVIICFGIAVIFIIEAFKSIFKKGEYIPFKSIVIEYILFLIIVLPLGFWWQIYSNINYGLPFNFVFKNLNSNLYTGTRSWIINNRPENWLAYYDKTNNGVLYNSIGYNSFIRFVLPFYVPDFNAGIFCNSFENYNLWSFGIRSALFGEFSYARGALLAVLLLVSSYFFIFTNLIAFVYNRIVKKVKDNNMMFALYLSIGIILFYIYLSISMPYGCSMDFRYIVPIFIPLAIIINYNISSLDTNSNGVISTILNTMIKTLIVLCVCLICLFYLVIA